MLYFRIPVGRGSVSVACRVGQKGRAFLSHQSHSFWWMLENCRKFRNNKFGKARICQGKKFSLPPPPFWLRTHVHQNKHSRTFMLKSKAVSFIIFFVFALFFCSFNFPILCIYVDLNLSCPDSSGVWLAGRTTSTECTIIVADLPGVTVENRFVSLSKFGFDLPSFSNPNPQKLRGPNCCSRFQRGLLVVSSFFDIPRCELLATNLFPPSRRRSREKTYVDVLGNVRKRKK